MSRPPLAVDIDGTLTRPEGEGIDPRAFDLLGEWADAAPVVVATGKAFPYPVALCHFAGVPERVVAENGGVVLAGGTVEVAAEGLDERAAGVERAFADAGGDHGWGPADTVNRWRETEFAVSREADRPTLERAAADHGMVVVDTGYAYHAVDPDVDKGRGLDAAGAILGLDPGSFVAVGDSENDVALFDRARYAYAVGNAAAPARRAADTVVEGRHVEGATEALADARDRFG